jgi:hypothetical protein
LFIPDPDADFLPIPDPGSRGQKGPGSRIRNTAYMDIHLTIFFYRFPQLFLTAVERALVQV